MENIIGNKINNKKQLVIFILVGVLIFIVGFVLGILFYQLQNKTLIENKEALSNLSSKVISSVVAYGQVKNIDGKNITLSNLGNDLRIKITDDAKIYSFADSTQGTVKFEDIKKGDNVNITVQLLQTGQFEGLSVIILPQSK